MRLHEYEAKEIFSKYDIKIPQGKLARTTEEAKQIAIDIGMPVVIKSQVLVGGRGKAGGVKIVENLNEVERVADEVLRSEIKGCKPEGILVSKKVEIKKEIYLGITIDRTSGIPMKTKAASGICLSPEGLLRSGVYPRILEPAPCP